jgi:chemotaxis protein histidine kinase CheA
MKKKPISSEQAAQLEEATIKNIVEKVGAGGIPTARELDMLKEATAEPPTPAAPAEMPEAEAASYGARLNLKQLARLTGKTRETIAQRLASLAHGTGKTGAKLYEAKAALEAIYSNASTSEAESRRHLNDARRELTTLQAECIRKERIPLDVITAINEAALGNVAGILKSKAGKFFDDQALADCFEELARIAPQVAEHGPTPSKPALPKAARKKTKPRKK